MTEPTIKHRPLTPDECRRAVDAYHTDLAALDARRVGALGGPLGLIHAKIEHLGSTCAATLNVFTLLR